MVDSHCHLADPSFAGDLGEVIERARAEGVASALCILAAESEPERARGREVSRLWPAVRFAIGVHPHNAGAIASELDQVLRLVREEVEIDPTVRAVGEIGLDYHYDFSPREVQREVFRRQVSLARSLRRPIVIHTREADDDTLQILQEEGRGEVEGVFHCFSGDAAMARRALDLGFYLSFAGIVTFPRADEVRAAVKVVPDDRVLAETDSPYLAPVPHRGRRNEPAWVARVVETLAEIRGRDANEMGASVAGNFTALFGP